MPDPHDQGNNQSKSLIDRNEEKTRENHHENHHERGGHGFLARWPGNLACFRADFLKKLKRISHFARPRAGFVPAAKKIRARNRKATRRNSPAYKQLGST
jgi:hypothetical protein